MASARWREGCSATIPPTGLARAIASYSVGVRKVLVKARKPSRSSGRMVAVPAAERDDPLVGPRAAAGSASAERLRRRGKVVRVPSTRGRVGNLEDGACVTDVDADLGLGRPRPPRASKSARVGPARPRGVDHEVCRKAFRRCRRRRLDLNRRQAAATGRRDDLDGAGARAKLDVALRAQAPAHRLEQRPATSRIRRSPDPELGRGRIQAVPRSISRPAEAEPPPPFARSSRKPWKSCSRARCGLRRAGRGRGAPAACRCAAPPLPAGRRGSRMVTCSKKGATALAAARPPIPAPMTTACRPIVLGIDILLRVRGDAPCDGAGIPRRHRLGAIIDDRQEGTL